MSNAQVTTMDRIAIDNRTSGWIVEEDATIGFQIADSQSVSP